MSTHFVGASKGICIIVHVRCFEGQGVSSFEGAYRATFEAPRATFEAPAKHLLFPYNKGFRGPTKACEASKPLEHQTKMSTLVVVVIHRRRSYIRLATCG